MWMIGVGGLGSECFQEYHKIQLDEIPTEIWVGI